jgi:SAM-dependent methyltransferase
MSSPIAKADKSTFDKVLIVSHQKLSHGHRIRRLVELFSDRITSLNLTESVKVLDVGCGDMALARGLIERHAKMQVTCVDIYPPPTRFNEHDEIWSHYRQFDGYKLPFNDNSYDLVLFSDVLHHVAAERLLPLLVSAGNVGKYVLIKDHFEYGFWSRQSLRAMDFIGNYGYGVSVPARYFSKATFNAAIEEAGLAVERLDVGIQLYHHLPLVRNILSPNWQFLATCSVRESIGV